MSKSLAPTRQGRRKSQSTIRLEYLSFTAIDNLLRGLPLPLAYRFSESILFSLFKAFPRVRKRVDENLNTAFPEGTENERIALDHIRYQAWFWTDMLLAPLLLRDEKNARHVDSKAAEEVLASLGAYRQNGVLVSSGHVGAPDICSLALSRRGYPLSVVVRELDNPLIHARLMKTRIGYDRKEIPKTGALRRVHRALRNKEVVGLQIDQDAGKAGCFIPFFNKPASTHTGPALAALLSDSSVVSLFCIREAERRFKFKIHVRGPYMAADFDRNQRGAQELTRLMTADIEEFCRKYPEQNLWAHRRWKTPEPALAMVS